ncbi:galactarate dehydratase [Proteiniclasticum sp. C24MP]|uniref:galactarate dehydratase n=1 Tax=Proteiniclasticum sp. C24MP TaxID=3374101 RepID=UPI003754FC95
MKKRLVKVHPSDNVEIVVSEEGLKKGEIIEGIEVLEDIPQSHKVNLVDYKTGDPIIRYNEIIGYAKEEIRKGSWITEHRLTLPKAPRLEELELATKVPDKLPPLEGYTFLGYRNPNGSVGTKNLLGITTSVQCVEGVLNIAVKELEKKLSLYPNVDGIMPINHNYGCGVAISAKNAEIPIRTIKNLSEHPNFGGEMLYVGLGCEKMIPEKVFIGLKDNNYVTLQENQGFHAMVKDIVEKGEMILKRLNMRKREVCDVKDLVVGLQCGGSDAFSGVTANPAVGYASDLLVRCGATVLFSEVTEVRDGVHLLTPRAETVEIADRIRQEMAWYDEYLETGLVDRDANPTPGNKKGGLANIVEKSLGSIAKSGNSAISDVLSPGEKVRKNGLVFAATPASDFVCGTLQMASGIHLQVFTTGRGTPYGLKMVPVIKVSTRNELKEKWFDLIDVNAGTIATGESTIEEKGWEIFRLILDIASGSEKCFADQWGIENAICLFNPAPIT